MPFQWPSPLEVQGPPIKYKTLRISEQLLLDFIRNPTPPGLTAEGMPADAVIVDAHYDMAGTLLLVLASRQFTDDEPELKVVFHKEHPGVPILPLRYGDPS